MEKNLEIKKNLISVYGLTDVNFEQIQNNGISLTTIAHQLSQFSLGITKTVIEKPATITDGIVNLSEKEKNFYTSYFDEKKDQYSLEKFVPASGAASRMFSFLSEFLLEYNGEIESLNTYIKRNNNISLATFIQNINKFPFYKVVYHRLKEKYADFDSWKQDAKNEYFIKILLDTNEFNYANKLKGILPFHDYGSEVLTPIEEHIKEAVNYCFSNLKAKLHFTISGEHDNDFKKIALKSESKSIHITFSEQLKNTDTIAVDHNNMPFCDAESHIIFKPGGHGALIYNLNQINSDIVFIKNIDNVSQKNNDEITRCKKSLAGYLMFLQNQIFNYLTLLYNKEFKNKDLNIIQNFIQNILNIEISKDFNKSDVAHQKMSLIAILNKPIRVCGMVKNENEPGGGPFWVKESSGKKSLQIVEFSQIDSQNISQVELFKSSTHFNPVDLVCGLKNYKGEKFNLLDFVDNNSGFIVEKSKNGIAYKAYELPGLWNGAMANWISIFVEVPLYTFNPVKTVNDLLKPNHQM